MASALTTTDARARSLELADARGYWAVSGPGQSVGLELDEDGLVVTYTRRMPNGAAWAAVWYTVVYDARRDDARCDCPTAQHGRPCWHRGQTVRSGRYVARRARLGWPED